MNLFSDFGLLPSLLKTLKEKKLFKPTEIQSQTIPLLMSGQSVVGVSETGSGKTLAYALPLLNLLKSLEDEGQPVTEEASPRAVVMVPTRELGEQVSKVFKTLTHDTRLRVRPALGGMALEQARRNTSGAFEILLATPGRLVQLLEKDLIRLSDVRMLIFDEADQMMDQGFLPDSNLIVGACPNDLQLALFSATVSTAVQDIMNDLFSKAEVVRSKGSGKVVASLVTKHLKVEDGKRWPLFEKLLAQNVEGGTIVFTNTREQCDKLAAELTEKGYGCVVYRGEMDKNERRMNLKKFKDGKVDLLVATDLAGRGLDIENVGRVINYHLPKQMENYLHRAGRTARAGRAGLVVNLVTERDDRLIARLEGNKPASLNRTPRPDGKPRVASTNRFKDARGVKSADKKVSDKSAEKSAEKYRDKSSAKSTSKTKLSDKPEAKATGKVSGKPTFKGGRKPAFKPKPKPPGILAAEAKAAAGNKSPRTGGRPAGRSGNRTHSKSR